MVFGISGTLIGGERLELLKRNCMEERRTEPREKQEPGSLLQWHPAFYANIQIELKNEADKLSFENEHQLGTKPMEIDVLVIKKETDEPIRKNIGRIFRTHNIIEYKSPEDYLSIDDFYKVYAYACFYKSDTKNVNSIPITEITITFVCSRYPRKLFRHLTEERGYCMIETDPGIYYIVGDVIPIQLIFIPGLNPESNLWLSSLTTHLDVNKYGKQLLKEYDNHKGNTLYQSAMDIIVRANKQEFLEVNHMCAALVELMEELMGDELKAREEQARREARQEGENLISKLIIKLSSLGRMDDIIKSASDTVFREKLIKEFGLEAK